MGDVSKHGNDHPHIAEHFEQDGYGGDWCQCPCSECTTSLGLCVCLECACELEPGRHAAYQWTDDVR